MTVLYGLNPFLILQTGSGHFDTYIATSLVFMIFFTLRKNEFRAGLISSIGTLFKYVPFLAFPNLLMQAKKKLLTLASLFVFVIVSLYFLITEYSRFIWVFTCRVEHAIQGMSAWHFIKIIVSGFKIENIDTIQKSLHSSDHFVLSYGWLFVFIPLFVAYLLFTYRNKEKFTSKDIPSLLYLPVIIFVMCGKVIGPNYLIWIFPLVLITKDERTYKMLIYVGFFFTVVLGITAFKLSQNTSVILSQMPAESVGVFMREVAKVLAAIPMPVWVFFVLISIVWFYWVMLKFLSENKVAKQYHEALKMLPAYVRNIVFKKLMKARYFGL